MQTATNPQTGEKVVFQNGQWVPLASAAPAQPQPMVVGTPRPQKPEVRQVGNSLGLVDPSTGSFTPTYTAPEKPEATGGEDDVKLQQKRASLESLVEQINRVDQLYRGGFRDEALGIISSLGEYLPSDAAAQLNAAGAGLAEQGLSAFRVPGVGAQSDAELRQFVEANRPSSWDRDTAIEEKLRQLRMRVDATRQEMGLPPAQWMPSDAPQEPAERLSQMTGGPRMEVAGADATTRSEFDAEQSAFIDQLIRNGTPYSKAMFEFRRRYPDSTPMDPKAYRDALQYAREHPEYKGSFGHATREIPLSSAEQTLNSIAQSGPGAFVARAGNAFTGNNLDSIIGATGGDAEMARVALGDMGEMHPGWSLAGDLTGGVGAALTGEAAIARLGMAPGLGRALLADTGYGAAAGAGASDQGSRLGGAATGALAGGAGSFGGNALMRTVGSAISPTGGNLSSLYTAGVRPTPGQRLAESGFVGRAVNATEEGLQSVPIVGSAIRGARQEARDQFQVGAFNQALGEIDLKLPKGATVGTKAHAFTQRAFDNAYNKAREGLRLVADEELSNQLAELSGQVGNLAKPSIDRFNAILRNVLIRRASGSELSGEAFKNVQKDLGKTIRGIRKSQSGDGELADALEDLQHILDNAARRHSDPEAVALLDKADRGYAKLVRIEEASARGGAMKDAGTFSPADLAGSVKRSETRVRSKAYSQGEALMQEYADQGKNLADRVPNSGTPERLMAGTTVAGGAAYLEPNTLTLLGALTAAYAPGGRHVVKGAMAPRGGPKTRAIAEQVRQKARLGGAVGGSQAALNYLSPNQR